MAKDFTKMTTAERDAEAEAFKGLTFEQTEPLSAENGKLWEMAKRGRPRKPPGSHAERVMITLDPALVAAVVRFAAENGLTRSGLIAAAVRKFIGPDRTGVASPRPRPAAAKPGARAGRAKKAAERLANA